MYESNLPGVGNVHHLEEFNGYKDILVGKFSVTIQNLNTVQACSSA